jgi:hypothetical protein
MGWSLLPLHSIETLLSETSNCRVMKSNMNVDPPISTIIQEEYKKIYRINQNICIGFTGIKDLCEDILSELKSYKPDELTLSQTCDYLRNRALAEKYWIAEFDNLLSFTIGGLTKTREINLYSFGAKYNYV